MTDAEREQRRSEQRELIAASIEQLRNSDGWRAYLQARRRLHACSAFIWRANVYRLGWLCRWGVGTVVEEPRKAGAS